MTDPTSVDSDVEPYLIVHNRQSSPTDRIRLGEVALCRVTTPPDGWDVYDWYFDPLNLASRKGTRR